MLVCEGLLKYYGSSPVINGVDFRLETGKILGLLGPNGAGKSTLLKLVTGLIWPDDGEASIDGHDVHREHAKAMQGVGAIIEWPSFFPYLTARENIRQITGLRGRAFDAKIEDAVKFVEMERWIDKKVGTFSTGMKQRIGLALAMLPESRFLILDEPTNGLDPSGMIELRQILQRVHRERGATILVSSHLLGEVEQICTDVAILHRGQIVANKPLSSFSEGDGTLDICAEPLENVRAVLAASIHDLGVSPHEEIHKENLFRVRCPKEHAAELNRRLVAGCCRVSHLAYEHKRLEEAFTELTRGGENVF